jgi:hypothetical protein
MVARLGLQPFDGRDKPIDLRLPDLGMAIEPMRHRL